MNPASVTCALFCLAEHWNLVQDEATKAESKSGLPMFGDRFTA